MKFGNSLQARLALVVGLSVTILWLLAAAVTAHLVGEEMEEVFDDGLKATAQRILPIARHDLREGIRRHRPPKDDDDEEELENNLRRSGDREARYGEDVTFLVRNAQGDVLLTSGDVDQSIFPPYQKDGFLRTQTHQLYYEAAGSGGLTIAVAEPLEQRKEIASKMLLGLLLPLIIVIPVSFLAIILGVRLSLNPIRAFRQDLAARSAQDLSPLADDRLPRELRPISQAVNQLLDRLRAAFNAERAFAANAAHELRTPVAGAIAQAQRIQTETQEKQSAQRAIEIEATLKRLMRMSEKLMQLARAEGGRLRTDEASDICVVLRMIAGDFERAGEGRVRLQMPEHPVYTTIDPDAVGILCRNLIENALKYGAQDKPVDMVLTSEGTLRISNAGPQLAPQEMQRLLKRFERGTGKVAGNGLGLAIVKAISDRVGAEVTIASPRHGHEDGVDVSVHLPL
ncbi:ATP-binding protein [Rhizobium sp. L1K21]|uniref:ATP-binding protein n=1 Tax=Rhizobium sp. L1K21 TaxID=2954933 RepID=UPI0020937A95|nr:ATP-binding protein [Rhizobium sp. L1K21]MCO6187046.1 ATP-binding protein [Rhizobium sp. L1K21]